MADLATEWESQSTTVRAKLNNWLNQWQSGKLGSGSRVWSFPCAFPSSTDVPVLLLNQPESTFLSGCLSVPGVQNSLGSLVIVL